MAVTDRYQQAEKINAWLSSVHQFLPAHPEIARMVNFYVKEKGEHDRARSDKWEDFKGPDKETLQILDQNFEKWLQNPLSFWAGRTKPNFGLAPLDQIVSCYLEIQCDDV